MSATALTPVLLLGALGGVALWIYADALDRARRGRPVVCQVGRLVIATPAMWLVGSVFLSLIVWPLYFTSRR